MSLWDRFLGRPESANSQQPSFSQVLAENDVVEVLSNGTLIVTPKQFKETPPEGSLGTSRDTPTFFGGTFAAGAARGEYNSALEGLAGLQKFNQMRRSDGTVQGILSLIKTPVVSARWFIQPASNSARDHKIADFVWKCLTEYHSGTWTQLITEILLMMDYGYYMFEKVWDIQDVPDHGQRAILRKIAPRHPMDVVRWEYDKEGGPNGVWMKPHPDMQFTLNTQQRVLTPGSPFVDPPREIWIPIDRLVVFTRGREADDMTGMSVLRPAYKHWYYKEQLYKIDAIQKERHGIGVPIIKLPMGFTDKDKEVATAIGQNLRTNELAHVVLPPNWEVLFAKLEGNPVDCMKSIEHHDMAIEKMILAAFMGDKGAKVEDQQMFLKAQRSVADLVSDIINKHLIPDIMRYNFDRGGMPKLRARRIGETEDQRVMSFALRNLIGANVIKADHDLEVWVRDFMDLPDIHLHEGEDMESREYDPEQHKADVKLWLEKELAKLEEKKAEKAMERAQAAGLQPAVPGQPPDPNMPGGNPDPVTRQTPPPTGQPAPNGGQDRSGTSRRE
jgi:hypothetical protein